MLVATLASNLLEFALTGKGIIRSGNGVIQAAAGVIGVGERQDFLMPLILELILK